MIELSLVSALAAARRWGYAEGVLAAYVTYVAASLSPWLGAAAAGFFLALGRGVRLDRLGALAVGLASAKFLLAPYVLGRALPYYEALFYAMRQSPLWQSYAPLTYLPGVPPLELAFGGTLLVVVLSALAGRALAEVLGPRAVYWPLLATEPLYFGHFYMSAPLAWVAVYYAARGRPWLALGSGALALGFHVYGGLLAFFSAALWGLWWILPLVPVAFLLPQSWVLFSYAARVPGLDPSSALHLFHYSAPLWLVKVVVEGVFLVLMALMSGRMAVVPAVGLVATLLVARSSVEFGGLLYRHFFLVFPFAVVRLGFRGLVASSVLSLAVFAVVVWFFGLDWGWAVAYASGRVAWGPVEEAYRQIYG